MFRIAVRDVEGRSVAEADASDPRVWNITRYSWEYLTVSDLPRFGYALFHDSASIQVLAWHASSEGLYDSIHRRTPSQVARLTVIALGPDTPAWRFARHFTGLRSFGGK